MNRTAMHKLWLRIHLYIGLGAGLVFVFIGLAGSVLVFYRSIDGWLNPTLLTASMPGESRPLDELIASLRSSTPDLPGPSYLDLPRTNTDVVHVWYRMREGPIRTTTILRYYSIPPLVTSLAVALMAGT